MSPRYANVLDTDAGQSASVDVAFAATGDTPATISVSNFSHRGVTQVWQLAAANAIARLGDVGVSGSGFAVTLPPQSVTLFVVAAGSIAPAAPRNLRVVR